MLYRDVIFPREHGYEEINTMDFDEIEKDKKTVKKIDENGNQTSETTSYTVYKKKPIEIKNADDSDENKIPPNMLAYKRNGYYYPCSELVTQDNGEDKPEYKEEMRLAIKKLYINEDNIL